MANVGILLDAWDLAHWELGEGLDGLADDDLWRRPAPTLVSVGEIMGHIAYAEATHFTGPAVPDDPRGLLVSATFRYYPHSLADPVALPLGVAQAAAELRAIHESAVQLVRNLDPDSATATEPPIGSMWDGATWFDLVAYMVFHVGYHTGQIYSARHLLGHETKDN